MMATRAPIDWQGSPVEPVELVPYERPAAATSFLENVQASFEEMRLVGNSDAGERRTREAWEPIIEAVNASLPPDRRFQNPARMANAFPEEYKARIFDEIRRRRTLDRNFLPGVPESHVAFDEQHQARAAARQAEIREVQSRGGWIGTVAGFIGGVGGALTDPLNLALMPIGGPARTFAGAVAREAVENMVIETALLPQTVYNYAELGEEITGRDMLRQVLFAGGAGAAVRGTVEGVARLPSAAGSAYDRIVEGVFNALPEPLQRRWAEAATVDDRLLADVLRARMPEEEWTPDLRDAVNVIEREAEIGEASPFMPGLAGDEAHAGRLAEALQRLIDETPRSTPFRSETTVTVNGETRSLSVTRGTSAGSGPGAVAAELRAAGMPEPVVAGFLGNFEVEGGYGGAVGDGGTAFGIAQWRAERVANFERVIGKHPRAASHAEQARFVRWEMDNPAAAGMTIAQRDAILAARTPEEAARLIDQFYERSSGAHRERRAEAARRLAGEAPEGAAPVARSAEGDAAAAPVRADEIAPAPVLRRELFASEAEWVQAQALLTRQADVPPDFPALEPANAPAARETGSGGAEGPDQARAAYLAAERENRVQYERELGEVAEAARDKANPGWRYGQMGAVEQRWRNRSIANRLRYFGPDSLPESVAGLRAEVEAYRASAAERGAGPGTADYLTHLRSWELAEMFGAPSQNEYIAALLGTRNWAVAPRLTSRLKAKGIEQAIPQARYREIEADWEAEVLARAGPVDLDATSLAPFADPDGAASPRQAAILAHDLRRDAEDDLLTLYQLDVDVEARPLDEIFVELDADDAAAAALAGCLE